MPPNATKLLVRSARQYRCDLVVADFYRVVGERVSPKGGIDEDGPFTREEYAAHMMENPADFYYGVLWNKLYRRDIIQARQLRMDPVLSWCEDFLFNLEYIRHAGRYTASSSAPPLPLVSTRLGEERTRVHDRALEGEGALCGLYRERKLLEYYLEPAAFRTTSGSC